MIGRSATKSPPTKSLRLGDVMSGAFQKAWKQQRRPQKYGAVAVITDDGRFDSKAELRRWCDLKLLERAGQITNLERQVRFPIAVNGVHVCDYIADFVFFENGARVVEDKKGVQTDTFRLKAKLMKALYNIEVRLT